MSTNIDAKTVEGFGEEWTRFDQTEMTASELSQQFERYFAVFPWNSLLPDSTGFDMGCGSGRWAKLAALRVGKLFCVDASADALTIARRNLAELKNVEFYHASVSELPFDDDSMDFAYSLGVLHHVPDTSAGIEACVRKLKKGAPLLLYLYYAFDNRPAWFRLLWRISDVFRQAICSLPFRFKRIITDLIAFFAYLPLARAAGLLEKAGFQIDSFPLSIYRVHSFYTMRTDALDRFGTRLEQRFTKVQIKQMMETAGLENIEFSNTFPYWCAVGLKK